jgi:hypothetical protein
VILCRRSRSASNSASVRLSRLAASLDTCRLIRCIVINAAGPIPGSRSHSASVTLATSPIEGQRPSNSARIAALARGGSLSIGNRPFSFILRPWVYGWDNHANLEIQVRQSQQPEVPKEARKNTVHGTLNTDGLHR